MKEFIVKNVGIECDIEKAQEAIENFKENLEETIGNVIVKKLQMESLEDAKEYLGDIFSGSPVAVRYAESISNFESSEKYNELQEKIGKIEEDIENFATDIFNRFKEQKSSKKGCDNCESNISREHFTNKIESVMSSDDDNSYQLSMKDLACPVCGNINFLITDGDKKKLEKLNERLEDTKNKLVSEKALYDIKNSTKIVNILIYT